MDVLVAASYVSEIEKTKNFDRDKDACQQRFQFFLAKMVIISIPPMITPMAALVPEIPTP